MRIKSGDNVMLSGSVGRDAESRTVGSGTLLVTFGLRTENFKDENGDWQSKWDNVSCFGEIAESARHIKKGDHVFVCGKIKGRKYTAKDGTEKTAVDITADFWCRMPRARTEQPYAPTGDGSEAFTELDDDGDLPF